MARYDNKRRKLYTNEYQNKDGRYIFHYTDLRGKKCKVYSWALKPEDIPQVIASGKKCPYSLRELEERITADKVKNLESVKSIKMTINDLFEENIELRHLRQSTDGNYRYMYERFIKPVFGSGYAHEITQEDIESFYSALIKKNKLLPRTIETIHTILSPIFDEAIAKRIIAVNPCTGAIKVTKHRFNEYWEYYKDDKLALTAAQQVSFVDYVKTTNPNWFNILVVFLGTGCRVSELMGLTWNDIDFENETISINHQLHYGKGELGKFEKQITPPKNKSSIRQIQMFGAVKTALLDERSKGQKCKESISGYIIKDKRRQDVTLSDFVFVNRFGAVQLPHNTNKAFERIRQSYNEHERELAAQENRKPAEIPHFSNHILRHTFTTRYCECNGNIGVLADMLGHADIKTTLNIYNDVQETLRKQTIKDLEDKIIIG